MYPILFHFGSFPVHSYGVMIALAFVFGLWTATLRARRVNVSSEVIADVTLWIMVGTILGRTHHLCRHVLEG
ncbi:MAG: prolipoprotein diacylglyceryl transferase family protein [Limisphaerales bacterium]